MQRLLCVVLIGVTNVSMPCFGQITETDTMKVNVRLSLNGNWSSGNVQRILILSQLESTLSSTDRNWVFKTQDAYRYGKVRSNLTENDLVLANYIYHKPFNRVYFYLMMLYETNLLKTIHRRTGGGPGMSFVLLKNETSLIKISFTAFVDRTVYGTARLSGTSDDSRIIDTWRPALRIFQRHNIRERLTLFYEFADQFSISKYGDHRLFLTAGINYNYLRVLDLIARWNYTHEDIVPEGIKADDWYLSFGINVHYQQ